MAFKNSSLGSGLGSIMMVSGVITGICTSFSSPLVAGLIITGAVIGLISGIDSLVTLHRESVESAPSSQINEVQSKQGAATQETAFA